VESGLLKSGTKNTKEFEDYLKETNLTDSEKKKLLTRMEMHDKIGNNQDYLGNGLTKDLIGDSPNNYGAVETLNFERKEVDLQALDNAGAISIITGLKPL